MSADPPLERARLFVALELPETARIALARWRSANAPELPGLRSVASEALHITLCFLGSRPSSEIELIGAACASSLSGQLPLELSFGAALWLPRRRPRVLAVAVEDTGGRLVALQGTLAQALSAGGWYEPERRSFLGHVTVARASRQTRVRDRLLEAPSGPAAFAADTVTLFRSQLARGGARYEALRRIQLGGR